MRATSVKNKNETNEMIKRSKAVNVFACTFRLFLYIEFTLLYKSVIQ